LPESDEAKRNTFGVEFPWRQGKVAFAGETLSDVGLRFKGNFTYMASAQALKKPLKLDFNRNVKGQKLDGLTRVNLHTGVSDPSRLREALSYALFRDLGVPVPRTAFAEVYLTVPDQYDHELVGVYTLVEEVNKTFLARKFGEGAGMLLKPEGLTGGPGFRGTKWKAYEGLYHPDSKPGENERARLIEFTRLIDRGSDAEFAERIGEYLDVPAFLRFIAANALLSNLDSYLGFGHNYYLYLVPGREQFVFIPWDLDLSLAAWPAVGTPEQLVELSIQHPHAGKNALIDRLLAIAEQREAYLQIVREMLETQFTEERFLARLDELEERLQGPLAAEAKAVASRREGGGRGPFGGGPGGAPGGGGPGGGGPGGGGPGGGGPFGGGPFGGGQFGQSLPPRQFITRRLASVTAQLEGKSEGYEPQPFGFGGPGGPGGPGGGPGGGPFGGAGPRGPGGGPGGGFGGGGFRGGPGGAPRTGGPGGDRPQRDAPQDNGGPAPRRNGERPRRPAENRPETDSARDPKSLR